MPENGFLSLNSLGDKVKTLQKMLRDAGLTIPDEEAGEGQFGIETYTAVMMFQKKHKLPLTGVADQKTLDKLLHVQTPVAGDKNRVQGRAVLEQGSPAEGVRLRLYHIGFGETVPKRIDEKMTDALGVYAFEYTPPAGPLNLEVRAVTVAGAKETETPLSRTRFDAGSAEVVNIVVPPAVKTSPAEYQRIVEDLKKHLGAQPLASAKENKSRQDLSLLHESTGWDARLIALAATAEKTSTAIDIPAAALYALFRSGFPSEPRQLAMQSPAAVEEALRVAAATKIVTLDEAAIKSAKSAFVVFSGKTRATLRATGAVSNIEDLLNNGAKTAGLSPQQKTDFERIVLDLTGDDEELWQELELAKVPTASLKIQGKLAYLTQNNAELIARVQPKIGDNTAALVDHDFHKPATWRKELVALAGGEAQAERLIPPDYTEGTLTERLDAYSADLARKVRISYPTQVIASMLKSKSGELRVGSDTVSTSVAKLLTDTKPLGFELGRVPVDSFLAKHPTLFNGVPAADAAATKDALRLLQRLYQITPNDDALKTSLELGIRSAYDLNAIPFDEFMIRYGFRYRTREEAELVYRRAQQVAAVSYNFFTGARQIHSATSVLALTPEDPGRLEATRKRLKDAFPTMETLFGSMDFCSCDHCSSVLSPAAYFVDLLKFLDPDPGVWVGYTEYWERTHGKPYPLSKPFDALMRKRPDLQHLPLTCANTNTAMPYIDLVNEILEYFVAHNGMLDQGVARETGNATTPDLLAEPQYLEPAAYRKLADAHYPIGLPFDLGSETVRRFFAHHEVRFVDVLDIFCPTEELFAPASLAKPYARDACFAEQLRLSPAELEIFTTPAEKANWFAFYGYTSASAARELLSAKTLARRLGVTYTELAALITMPFINPKLEAVAALRKIGISAETIFRSRQKNDFPALTASEQKSLNARFDEARTAFPDFDPQDWITKAFNAGDFDGVIVLRETGAACDFETTHVVHAAKKSTDPLPAIELHKLNLFVRLWRKLGWTIEETDVALRTFLPRKLTLDDFASLSLGFRTALIGIAHLAALNERLPLGRDSRMKLLTLWGDLPAAGKTSLYARLFLTPAVLKNDPVFDHPLGAYLTANRDLKNHQLTVQGVLGVTADEIEAIVVDGGGALASAKLTLASVSLIYRHALLARALRISIRDLITLRRLSGIDPFAPLSAVPLQSIDDDAPLGRTIAFVDLVEAIRDTGLTIEDVAWMLRHKIEPLGKHKPNPEELRAFLRELAAEIARIRTEHAAPADSAKLGDDVIRREVASVLAPDVAEGFMAMWSGAVQHEAMARNILPADRIDDTKLVGERNVRVRYEEKWKRQTLTYAGVLHGTESTRLAGLVGTQVFTTLLNEVETKSRELFEARLVHTRPGGFLDSNDFELLFAISPAAGDDAHALAQREEAQRQRRARLAGVLMPHVQSTLIRRLVIERLAQRTGLEAPMTEALLTDSTLLRHGGAPLIDSIIASADSGFTRTRPDADNETFDAWIEMPATGTYRFSISLEKKDAKAELHFDHLPAAIATGTAASDGASINGSADLESGVPYHCAVIAKKLGGGAMVIEVESDDFAATALERLSVPPPASVARAAHADVVMAKAALLIGTFGLTLREVRTLLAKPAPMFDLDSLPSAPVDDTAAAVRTKAFERLAAYGRLRRDMAGGSDALTDVLTGSVLRSVAPGDVAATRVVLLTDLARRIAEITRRDATTVRSVIDALGIKAIPDGPVVNPVDITVPALSTERGLRRLWDALRIAYAIGVSADDIKAATRVASPIEPFDSRLDLSRRLRNALKARYDSEQWQRAGRAIFDPLRQRQRDALVAYLLHELKVDRVEQLFEEFLIDPGMEPVVQTSRLRLALSSVQLFVQRALMNLEKEVEPTAINSAEWEWMKRYRVWEANRKIFLFPENWLEPEFRDEKTHLCKELEDAMFSGDVTTDLAEDAFFDYLRKLDELARLEIVTMYLEEKPLDPAANTVHVIGRTFGVPHKYFYRRYAHRAWTPWEPVTIDIEGDHVVAVMWRERICLFWLTFVEHTVDAVTESGTTFEKMAKEAPGRFQKRELEINLNWTERLHDEWAPRRSGPSPIKFPMSGSAPLNLRGAFVHATRVLSEDGEERGVRIHLTGTVKHTVLLEGRNADPKGSNIVPANAKPPESAYNLTTGRHPTHHVPPMEERTLTVKVVENAAANPARTVLANLHDTDRSGFSVLLANDFSPNFPKDVAQIVTPFFYEDSAHTFFVEPTLIEETIETYDWWVIRDPILPRMPKLPISPIVPRPEIPDFRGDPGIPDAFEDSLERLKADPDWVTDPRTLLEFDGFVIAGDGGFDPKAAGLSLRSGIGSRDAHTTIVVDGARTIDVHIVGSEGAGPILAGDLTRIDGLELPSLSRHTVLKGFTR